MKPGDLAVVKLGKPRMLTKINATPENLTLDTIDAGIVPEDAIVLICAIVGHSMKTECLVLGPNMLGWTYVDRLEEPRAR